MNSHASALNTLLARGKSKRATRTSSSYEGTATQHVSVRILGNANKASIASKWEVGQGWHRLVIVPVIVLPTFLRKKISKHLSSECG